MFAQMLSLRSLLVFKTMSISHRDLKLAKQASRADWPTYLMYPPVSASPELGTGAHFNLTQSVGRARMKTESLTPESLPHCLPGNKEPVASTYSV